MAQPDTSRVIMITSPADLAIDLATGLSTDLATGLATGLAIDLAVDRPIDRPTDLKVKWDIVIFLRPLLCVP